MKNENDTKAGITFMGTIFSGGKKVKYGNGIEFYIIIPHIENFQPLCEISFAFTHIKSFQINNVSEILTSNFSPHIIRLKSY